MWPRSEALKRLVLEMYVRGLSTRDVEAVFPEAFREEVLSRSGVSRLGRELQVEFDRWRSRDLSDLPVVYLFLDACSASASLPSSARAGISPERRPVRRVRPSAWSASRPGSSSGSLRSVVTLA